MTSIEYFGLMCILAAILVALWRIGDAIREVRRNP
jgi:hypothetical protein